METSIFTDANYKMKTKGWHIFREVVDDKFLTHLRHDLDTVYQLRRKVQIKNGIGDIMSGTCHHLLGENTHLDTFIHKLFLHDFILNFFGDKYILNSFGAFINQPHDTAYVSNIHRDVRTHAGNFKLMLNILVMLDDFTLENGATYVLSGSHLVNERPAKEMFYADADRVTGNAGDILVFDSNLWHAAGDNNSNTVRRGLTLTYSRPFFKQQIDFPQLLGNEYAKDDSEVRQVLGYNARVPVSIDQFYQPPEKRCYKADQEIKP